MTDYLRVRIVVERSRVGTHIFGHDYYTGVERLESVNYTTHAHDSNRS